MLKEADEYIKWGKDIVIKVVMTPEGMKAVKRLSSQRIKTNVTLIFSPIQALIAAKAGATYGAHLLDDLTIFLITEWISLHKSERFLITIILIPIY